MYEPRHEPLLPRAQFFRRLGRHSLWALGVLLLSLAIGMAGFHWLSQESWVDAFVNSTMLLGGMGPVGSFDSTAGKLFAGLYALYAGIVFLGAAALLIAPVLHRMLHKLHLAEEKRNRRRRAGKPSKNKQM
ncbi:MAG: hypothetical protein A3H96_19380 [Acidobacteria bacterium RIFCSPLOWO2_02_FULL_67_36]|nr:MAG: hypothetical protein A3H96_19380 [Acidobacteria bacterium RIFCSPLOWO2_02_FULL_67_36]OFW25283.1 MAG: hypothetical protein A3G21_19905 [Acidobacteria bacterium RIFCSPLOWO2_12_FULL_66_21]